MKSSAIDVIINVALIAASVVCFGVFSYNAARYATELANQAMIGSVAEGVLEQRRHGGSSFADAKAGDQVYYRDLIWVGPGRQARISFTDGTELKFFENTFAVLMKLPGGAAPVVKLLKGNVEVTRKAANSAIVLQTYDGEFQIKELEKPEAMKIPARRPPVTQEPEAPASKPLSGIYPPDGSLIYIVNANEAKITIAWPEAMSGTFILTEKQGPEVVRKQLTNATSLPVKLALGKSYEWRIEPGQPKAEFEVRQFTTEAVAEQMDPNSTRVIEIIGNDE